MNRALSKFCKEEYERFRTNLIHDWGVPEAKINSHDQRLRSVHKRYLSLACVASVTPKKKGIKEFLRGVVEAGYLSQVLAARGLENPALVLLRQTIEQTLKHIYLSFHPVEYSWVCSRVAYRELSFQMLLDFVRKTDKHNDLLRYHMNLCEKLDELFGELSRHVHVHSRDFMGYLRIGSKAAPSAPILKRLDSLTRRLWPLLVLMITVFFPEAYHAAQTNERNLILNCLSCDQRRFLHRHSSENPESRYKLGRILP